MCAATLMSVKLPRCIKPLNPGLGLQLQLQYCGPSSLAVAVPSWDVIIIVVFFWSMLINTGKT